MPVLIHVSFQNTMLIILSFKIEIASPYVSFFSSGPEYTDTLCI
jgi:hypothetical protein